MTTRVDLTGMIFNNLTVLVKHGKDKFGNSLWKCICTCGETKIVNSNKLQTGQIKSCGCLKLTENLVGRKFSYLTVLERIIKPSKRWVYWLCKCDCGNEKIIRGDSLKSKETLSCGCMHPRKPYDNADKAKMANARRVFARYCDGNLTFEQFYELSQMNCYYCNSNLSNCSNSFSKKSSSFSRLNGDYLYNGLDRIDSSKPHNIDNVVPSCFQCNWSKSNRSIENFQSWAIRLVINLCKKDKNKAYDMLKMLSNINEEKI